MERQAISRKKIANWLWKTAETGYPKRGSYNKITVILMKAYSINDS
jgi:hypothetical protein